MQQQFQKDKSPEMTVLARIHSRENHRNSEGVTYLTILFARKLTLKINCDAQCKSAPETNRKIDARGLYTDI